MRMVQVSIDQIIHMIPMRHRFVTAAGSMDVIRVVSRAGVLRRADIGIGRRYGNRVLIDMVAVRMVQVAVMQVIHMVLMTYGDVSAAGSMDMVMVLMVGVSASRHAYLLWKGAWWNHAASAAWVRMLCNKPRTCSSARA
jgi:hypothetical protein